LETGSCLVIATAAVADGPFAQLILVECVPRIIAFIVNSAIVDFEFTTVTFVGL